MSATPIWLVVEPSGTVNMVKSLVICYQLYRIALALDAQVRCCRLLRGDCGPIHHLTYLTVGLHRLNRVRAFGIHIIR